MDGQDYSNIQVPPNFVCGGYTNMEFAKTAVMPKRNLTSTGKQCLTFDTMLLLFTSYVPYTGDLCTWTIKLLSGSYTAF